LGEALVLPQYLLVTPEGLKDPAAFLHEMAELSPVPEPPPLPPIEGVDCPRLQIYALLRYKRGCVWKTDGGDVIWKSMRAPEASLRLPELVMVRRGIYVNRDRIARIRHTYIDYLVTLDNGVIYRVRKRNKELPERFGFTTLSHLEPYNPGFFGNYALRDWPFELALCGPEVLRGLFSSARHLIANLAYQRLRYRQQGDAREWADSYRGFWYSWVKHTLYHAGFLGDGDLSWPAPEFPDETFQRSTSAAQKMYYLVFDVFAALVDTYRLFTFEEFGFVEPKPEFRRIGTVRPEVILVTEKGEFMDWALRLHQEFGVSLRMLSSQPSIIGTEFFAKALRPHVTGPVRVIAYVDYDVGGWIIARAFAKQLEDQGFEVERVDFLIKGDTFTAEEKRLHAKPLATTTAGHRTKARLWFAETNGVDGKMLGIQADHIKPYARLRGLFLANLDRR